MEFAHYKCFFIIIIIDWNLNSDHLVKRGLKKYFRVVLLTMGHKISQSSPFLLMTDVRVGF